MKRDNIIKTTNLLYVLPMLIFFGVFILSPIIQVFENSFLQIKANGDVEYIQFDNYIKFFNSKDASMVLKNTFIWVFVGVAAKILIGLLMALVLYNNFVGKRVLTGVMLIPYAMPAAVSCVVWRLMYHPTFGHITQLLLDLNILERPMSFLGNPATSLLAVLIVNVWAVAPFCALNILASLYSIPTYIYEAASIDGAGHLRKFFHITIHLIFTDVRTLALLIGIWAFNSFDVIYMMTTGGPANSSSILVNLVYQNAFEFNNRGYASAISIICFIILSIFSVLYVRSKNKEVSFE